ncbi:hypothetical protein J2T02_003619 [Chitinophaga terrae (ex Kim and Jung 2007)]|uniref:SEFIR domain-containing protein n=1 Tax=Chitinophaga terrae (ex Kim and Jung 2007) TaxID=408074 RepID=UPI0027831294|nr:SEFIR domain-containing protein [Chitinophaga terrae (ex Kim and Jung 2007)]MDQ0108486.1 hypothetical protein [Chitinophaga terrae (ex Kim and Jung 2007)]
MEKRVYCKPKKCPFREETMNKFYDIGSPGKEPSHPMQLKHLGSKIGPITIRSRGSSFWGESPSPSRTYYRDTTAKDYDRQFVHKILTTYPPYDIELLLNHHYNLYLIEHPAGHFRFQKHIKYVIIPALERKGNCAAHLEIITQWLNSAPIIKQSNMTANQQLNKILAYIVANPDKNNVDANVIRDVIFSGSISFDEAQQLFLRIVRTGRTRLIGYRFLAFSSDTKRYLDDGGFGGEFTVTANQGKKPNSLNNENNLEVMKAFVTYAWGDIEHEKKVRAFTDYLRKKGIPAEMDVMLSQKETSINFKKMMHLAMQYPKVIVVLSENYKVRADAFAGGVGTEYTMLINDISDNPEKYILVSFNGRSPSIVPFGLKGNDIVDLSLPDGDETLLRKLTDQHKYVFAEVAPEYPKFDSKKIDNFKAVVDTKSVVSIENPMVKTGSSSLFCGQYNWIEFDLQLYFKNISDKPMDGFSYDLKLKQQLMPELYDQTVIDGFLIFNENLSEKIYPNRLIKGKSFTVKVSNHSLRQILGSKITITVYTDHGEHSKGFEVEEILKVRPSGSTFEERALSQNLFVSQTHVNYKYE